MLLFYLVLVADVKEYKGMNDIINRSFTTVSS